MCFSHVNNVAVKTVGGISLSNGKQLEESEGYSYFFIVFYVLESKQIGSYAWYIE